MIDGLDKVCVTEVVATDRRSATDFMPVGALPHLLDTHPPTLPMRPRLP